MFNPLSCRKQFELLERLERLEPEGSLDQVPEIFDLPLERPFAFGFPSASADLGFG